MTANRSLAAFRKKMGLLIGRRWLVLLVGWTFIVLGILGLFLPVLQGVLFLLIGLIILSSEYVWAHRVLAKLRVRVPRLAHVFEEAAHRARGWVAPMDSREDLKDRVCRAYSAASERPWDRHPFPVGRAFAESLGYPKVLLDSLPSSCVEGFAGVSSVPLFAEIPQTITVLDLGCGAGLDSLIAAGRVGSLGTVIGIDFSAAMVGRARQAAAEAAIQNVHFEQADAECLPVATGSVDVALVNGIFNLNPARESIFKELARVLRQGGAAYIAELILAHPLPASAKQNEADWFT